MTSSAAASGHVAKHSISRRFLITLAAQISKSAFSFLTGLVVARGLGPTEYGNLAFLLGSFTALRVLLDMSSGLACFTLVSQRPRGVAFYIYYTLWLGGLQIALPLILIALLLPTDMVAMLWGHQVRERVWLAFIATQLQFTIWPQIIQLGEIVRRTYTAQTLTILISIGQFLIVAGLYFFHLLSLSLFLVTTVIAFLLGTIMAFAMLPRPWHADAPYESLSKVFMEFFTFCRPLAFSFLVQAVQGWTEVWLLQHYAGAKQQGYYALGMQLSMIGLLATTALQNIFWREVSAIEAVGDDGRVREMYITTSRMLLFAAAAPIVFLLSWTPQIVKIALGAQYSAAVPAIGILLVYPVIQCLTTLVFILYYAMRQTERLATITGISALANIVGSYFILAPHNALVPGLQLGAAGMGIRIVIVASVNLLVLESWIYARRNWKHDWGHRAAVLSLLLLAAFASRSVGAALGLVAAPAVTLAVGAIVFAVAVLTILYFRPGLAGASPTLRDRYIKLALRLPPGP